MKTDQELRDIFTAAIPYVNTLRKKTGGFGATPHLPATIEDTYHALSILDLSRRYVVSVKEPDPRTNQNLRTYLTACRGSLPTGPRTTYQLLRSCRAVGMKIDSPSLEADVIARIKASDLLTEWYYGAKILTNVLHRSIPAAISEWHELTARLAYRAWRTVDEAWMQLYLLQSYPQLVSARTADIIAWFQAGQNGDGGFGFFPGTTSFVENCHTCLRTLALLHARPTDPARAFDFLAGCQTVSGGFGRGIRAAPFLDATWHALAGMTILRSDWTH